MTRWITFGGMAIVLALIGHSMMATVEAESPAKKNQLTWYTFDKGLEIAGRDNKYVVIDFYTDWCSWCKVMDEKTYGNPEVKALMDQSFVFIKVNAESKRFLKVRGQNITETHLASIYKVRSFPTTWFLEPNGKPIAPISGYIPPEKFDSILQYIKDGAYKNMAYDEYLKRSSD